MIAKALLAAPHSRHWGYALAKETDVAPGVLYPILARLEKLGWATSDWDTTDEPGPRRRYYLLTDDGRQNLHKLVEKSRW